MIKNHTPNEIDLTHTYYKHTPHLLCSYGWKWENKPSVSDSWRGYYANYLEKDSYYIREYPFYLLYGGWVGSGSLTRTGGAGYYWSSTAYYDTDAYTPGFYESDVYPSRNYAHYAGLSIRCLAR